MHYMIAIAAPESKNKGSNLLNEADKNFGHAELPGSLRKRQTRTHSGSVDLASGSFRSGGAATPMLLEAAHRHTLRELLSRRPAQLERIVPKFVDILSTIEAAHQRKKQHRNLKPERIKFTGGAVVEIPAWKQHGCGVATCFNLPKYAAPEDLAGSVEYLECRSRDSYVLGFMFYEVLAGIDLFEAEFRDVIEEGDLAWVLWHTDETRQVTPLSSLLPGFPQWLSDLINGMMIKNPSHRAIDLNAIAWLLASGFACSAPADTTIPPDLAARRHESISRLRLDWFWHIVKRQQARRYQEEHGLSCGRNAQHFCAGFLAEIESLGAEAYPDDILANCQFD